MAGVRPITAIIVFVIIIIIAAYIAWRANPITFDDSRVRVFLVALVSLGIIMTVLFFYGTLVVQQMQQEATIITQTTVLGNDILNGVLVEIENSVPVIPNFALSLLPLQNNCDIPIMKLKHKEDKIHEIHHKKTETIATCQGCAHIYNLDELQEITGKHKYHACAHGAAMLMQHKLPKRSQIVQVDHLADDLPQRLSDSDLSAPIPLPKRPEGAPVEHRVDALPPDPCTPEAIVRRTILSFRVFSLWQEVTLYGNLIAIEPLAYVTNFLQRANSVQLYAVWQTEKINFNKKTQQFGDLLFCYGLRVHPQTPKAYVCAAKKLLASGECEHLKVKL